MVRIASKELFLVLIFASVITSADDGEDGLGLGPDQACNYEISCTPSTKSSYEDDSGQGTANGTWDVEKTEPARPADIGYNPFSQETTEKDDSQIPLCAADAISFSALTTPGASATPKPAAAPSGSAAQ